MSKSILVVVCTFLLSISHASQLSRFLENAGKEDQARQEREWREDMNFGDFAFRLEKRYVDGRGQNCRDYIFRARSNPFRAGSYTICDSGRNSNGFSHGHQPPRARVE
jgi:hypothetical protein